MSKHGSDNKADRKSAWRRLLPVSGMVSTATFLPPVGTVLLLGTMPMVGPWLADQQWVGLAVYVVAFIFLAGLALLPTYAQAVLGGWAFGFALGFPATMIGFTGAALLAHSLAGRIAGNRLVEVIERKPKWRVIHEELAVAGFGRTTLIVTLLRLPPISPFALTNVLLASARVPRLPFVVGTILGLAPRTAAAVFIASGLEQLDFQQVLTTGPDWPILLAIASTLVSIILIGLLAHQALHRMATERARARENNAKQK